LTDEHEKPSTTPTAPGPVPLGYAAGASLRRRRVWRRLIGVAVVATLVIAGVRHGPGLLARAKLLSEQRAWLDYAAPADQVMLLEDWRRGFLGLLVNEVEGRSDPGLATVEWLDHMTATVAARPLAGLDAFLARQGMSPVARRDRYGTESRPTPVLFCGERASAAGRSRRCWPRTGRPSRCARSAVIWANNNKDGGRPARAAIPTPAEDGRAFSAGPSNRFRPCHDCFRRRHACSGPSPARRRVSHALRRLSHTRFRGVHDRE